MGPDGIGEGWCSVKKKRTGGLLGVLQNKTFVSDLVPPSQTSHGIDKDSRIRCQPFLQMCFLSRSLSDRDSKSERGKGCRVVSLMNVRRASTFARALGMGVRVGGATL